MPRKSLGSPSRVRPFGSQPQVPAMLSNKDLCLHVCFLVFAFVRAVVCIHACIRVSIQVCVVLFCIAFFFWGGVCVTYVQCIVLGWIVFSCLVLSCLVLF